METENVQDLVENALETAIDALDLVATDEQLDRRLRDVQRMCNKALIELRGFGHEAPHEEWEQN